MKTLLLLISLLFFTACTPTIHHVKKDLDKNKFERAMYDLKKMKKITPDKFSVIYESIVTTLTPDQTKQMMELIMQRGADINAQDGNGLTLIDYAYQKSDTTLLTYLIDQGAVPPDVDALFELAILQEGTAFSDFLFSKGYTYSKANELFSQALISQHYNKANYWLKHGADINHDPLRMRLAVDNEDLQLAHYLLDNGFNLKADKLLLSHVIKEEKVMFLAMLIAEKVDVNADKDLLAYILALPDYPLADYLIANGATLHDPKLFEKAIHSRDYKLVSYLIKHGMSATFPSSELTQAFREKDLKFAHLLMQMGVKMENNYTPLTYCARLHYKDGMALVLEQGANVNQKDKFGRTALMYVADDLILTDWLVHQGADVNAVDNQGRTTLMYAVAFNDVVDNLIIHGADAYAKDDHRRSLLSYAISNNNMKLVKELVEYKQMPLNEEDRDGRRPLNFAQDLEMTRYLMKHKARH